MIRRKFFAACAAAAAGVCGLRETPITQDPYVPGPLRPMPQRFRISRVDIINPEIRSTLNHGAKWRTTPWQGYSETTWHVVKELPERTA